MGSRGVFGQRAVADEGRGGHLNKHSQWQASVRHPRACGVLLRCRAQVHAGRKDRANRTGRRRGRLVGAASVRAALYLRSGDHWLLRRRATKPRAPRPASSMA